VSVTDFAYFGINLLGIIFIYSALEKETEPFLIGAFLAGAAGMCFWVLVHRMQKLKAGNAISMNLTIIIILIIFLPTFFPMMPTDKPSVGQFLLMLVLGWVGFTVIVFVSRSIQIMKVRNFMLMCTLFLVGKGVFDGYKEGDLDMVILLGSALTVLGVCLVVRDVRSRVYVENKTASVPLIQNI
jgi:hypothetical protein